MVGVKIREVDPLLARGNGALRNALDQSIRAVTPSISSSTRSRTPSGQGLRSGAEADGANTSQEASERSVVRPGLPVKRLEPLRKLRIGQERVSASRVMERFAPAALPQNPRAKTNLRSVSVKRRVVGEPAALRPPFQ